MVCCYCVNIGLFFIRLKSWLDVNYLMVFFVFSFQVVVDGRQVAAVVVWAVLLMGEEVGVIAVGVVVIGVGVIGEMLVDHLFFRVGILTELEEAWVVMRRGVEGVAC